MQTNFAYGGTRKSALTVRTFLFGAYRADYKAATGAEYEGILQVGQLPITPSGAADLINTKDIQAIDAKISELAIYDKAIQDYYDRRVRQGHGEGKTNRLKQERGDIRGVVAEVSQLLRSGAGTIEREKTSKATSTQYDYNRSTGKPYTKEEIQLEVDAGKRPGPGQDSSFNATSLIIPVGAALAALFFLKGH